MPATPEKTKPPSFHVLGVRVDALQIPGVIAEIESWIARRERCHYIAVTGMHGVTEALHDAQFRAILNSADLVVPDGMPLVWLGRWRGHSLRRRVYGPELMMAFCQVTAHRGYRHFFYGGRPGIAETLASRLQAQIPNLQVAGTYAPPFRALTPQEEAAIVRQIECSAADVIWVGLGTPKQERWMSAHRDRLRAPVLLGVGAAFDIHAGALRQAPAWMRERGLEWLFRLSQEPKRLWRRYLVTGADFAFHAALEICGLRRFD
ncbi:MAG: WecB/TagA/CpsF family glycosyltransferase [Candidatus Acidiferrales bacterium]